MAQESILDRLDRDPGGARQYVATLLVIGGATRSQVAEAMARKYQIPAPTGRSVTAWKNNDPELRTLIQQMEAAKRDVAPGDDPMKLMPRAVNPAQVDSDLFSLCVDVPAFGELLQREWTRQDEGGDTRGAFEQFDPPPPGDDDAPPDDTLAVLLANHETVEDFEADCLARLAADPLPDDAAIA